MNMLGHEVLRFVQTFSDTEQEQCRTSAWSFEMLIEKVLTAKVKY